ncbi:MAG TPA: FAD-binding and (Fe-S)-binding domain-containing protein [Candidatus Baltobacteraceae bacterium]|nr:FAD-binding and (Fe-S)-binding domain-containing protein [Candidatus Baltobacteraceae bacterium]
MKDVQVLERALREATTGEVRFSDGDRAMYAYDASVYRQVPIGVVIPKSADDVEHAVAICREHAVPILGRGCGTSLAGQCCNAAVIIDTSKYMHAILDIDAEHLTARVQPGVICDSLAQAASSSGIRFGPDPATHDHCTLGGMIGNNSCGTHALLAGRTADNVLEMDVLTYDGLRMRVGATSDKALHDIIAGGGRRGEIYAKLRDLRDRYAGLIRKRFPNIPRLVSGYSLDMLLPENGFNVARALVGSEGTCALTLEATLRMVHQPQKKALVVLGFPDLGSSGDIVPLLHEHGPIAIEFFSSHVIRNLDKKHLNFGGRYILPDGKEFVVVQFGAQTQEEADSQAEALRNRLARMPNGPHFKLVEDKSEQEAVWEIRRHSASTARMPIGMGGEGGWPNWEDAALAPERLGDYLRDFEKLLNKFDYDGTFYGHWGQGCIHCRIDFKFRTADNVKHFRSFMEEAADLVVSYGGVPSGEHGDGHGRAELLPKAFGEEIITAFREFKAIWDPHNKMNPGKLVDPYPLDSHLREGTSYTPINLDSYFAFPEDNFSFMEASNRCFGIGKCRHLEGGTMCPSFMATREEKHSTRGRARLLQEMMRPESPTKRPWKNEAVKEALDLCLACKGCKGDCPVQVDMATYKAEFLAHYYKGRMRPPAAYAMGLIPIFAPIAAQAPDLVNGILSAPVVSTVLKAIAGLAPQRELPRFAAVPFDRWFARHAEVSKRASCHAEVSKRGRGIEAPQRVVLWADTFNTYFTPEVAIAATLALEELGFEMVVPRTRVCCGRPFFDYGFLTLAQAYFRDAIRTMEPFLRDGTPIVGLEPSCIAAFRDELVNMFPNDLDAQRLSQQTYTLAEFLEKKAGNWHWHVPKLHKRAIVQVHCHHDAVMKFKCEQSVLEKLGLQAEVPDTGCCGMAGSFGYEAGEKYDVSMQVGEQGILPKVRDTSDSTLVIADGFSCRHQIEEGAHRKPLHLAQVLRMAQEHGRYEPQMDGLARGVHLRELAIGAGALAVTVLVTRAVRGSI